MGQCWQRRRCDGDDDFGGDGDGDGDGVNVDDGDWATTMVTSIAFPAVHGDDHGDGDSDGNDGYVHRALIAMATPMASAMPTLTAMATFIEL